MERRGNSTMESVECLRGRGETQEGEGGEGMTIINRFLEWFCNLNADFPIVSDYGLTKILNKYGLREDFEAGRIKCAETGQTITRKNLAIIREETEGKIEFIATMNLNKGKEKEEAKE